MELLNAIKSNYIALEGGGEVLSSPVRVTSAKSQPKLLDVGRYRQTPGPIDQTPETPGSGKNPN